ncbi:hypothetical protein [Brevibacterium oceani]|uniref:hypothetical protein n=1 Tax=Brevibacterium oceani TaxID=358099 RepID=UPI0015E7A1BC|nr:hypothetical protein [Brevibacterium oceani]
MTESDTRSHSTPEIPEGFWGQIDHQLDRIEHERPTTFDEVRTLLLDLEYEQIVLDVHRNFPRAFDLDSAFFAGSGGDRQLRQALHAAGWRTTESRASYYYTMRHRDTGEELTYIEGDVVRGDQFSPGT